MPKVDIKQLLEAGAHFGHATSRWHPKMSPYIHSKRGGNHVIDLTKTVEALDIAIGFISKTAAEGKQVLLVSTKRQAKDKVKEVAIATGMPYVTERWLGGMMTNKATIGGRIKHLKDLETRMANGELAARYSKLEVQRMQEEIDQMNHNYGGIKEMAAKVGAVFVVDILNDDIAVREAHKLDIPVVGLVDSNGDPTSVDYPIPCNDDATKTINLILDYIQQAIEEGKGKIKQPVDSGNESQDKKDSKSEPAVGKDAKPVDASPPPRAKKPAQEKPEAEAKPEDVPAKTDEKVEEKPESENKPEKVEEKAEVKE